MLASLLGGSVTKMKSLSLDYQPDPVAYAMELAETILRIAPSSAESSVAFAYLLGHDPLKKLQLRAARELSAMGSKAKQALPILVASMKDGILDAELSCAAINCVVSIGVADANAVAALEALAGSSVRKVAGRARSALTVLRQRGRKN